MREASLSRVRAARPRCLCDVGPADGFGQVFQTRIREFVPRRTGLRVRQSAGGDSMDGWLSECRRWHPRFASAARGEGGLPLAEGQVWNMPSADSETKIYIGIQTYQWSWICTRA